MYSVAERLSCRTIRTLIIEGVTDELFWYFARHNESTMGYYGDDAYISHVSLPKKFIDLLPDNLKSEWRTIWRSIKRSKYHRLEVHPKSLSDKWDKTHQASSAAEFIDWLYTDHWMLNHYTSS
jgi:hypothetical protein